LAIDEQVILRIERHKDDVSAMSERLKGKYKRQSSISARVLRSEIRILGEKWISEFVPRQDVREIVGQTVWGDLTVQFTRLMTVSERNATRSEYDAIFHAILHEFTARVLVPLKVRRTGAAVDVSAQTSVSLDSSSGKLRTLFIGHSFNPRDARLVTVLTRVFDAFGIVVRTGERPKADSVSQKVKERIVDSDGFVGLFTRRERIGRKNRWTTSTWVIDEKSYAHAHNKKMIIIKEDAVDSIGGIQGDYEYLPYVEGEELELVLRLLELLTQLQKRS